MIATGSEIDIQHEGCGSERMLLIDYDGAERRVTFDLETGDLQILESAEKTPEPTAPIHIVLVHNEFTTRIE